MKREEMGSVGTVEDKLEESVAESRMSLDTLETNGSRPASNAFGHSPFALEWLGRRLRRPSHYVLRVRFSI